jgi:hypothetical protein
MARRMTNKELAELDKTSKYGEVSGADLASALAEAKRARASEAALLSALEVCARNLKRLEPWIDFKGSPTGGEDDAVANFRFAVDTAQAALKKAKGDG